MTPLQTWPLSRGFMAWNQGRSNSKMDLKKPQKGEFARKQGFLTFFRSLMLWGSDKRCSVCLGKRHLYKIDINFQKIHRPHRSQIENATLREERVTDKTHDVVLGLSCLQVGGSFENSWRPAIKTKHSFFKGSVSAQSIATVGPSDEHFSGAKKRGLTCIHKYHHSS